MSTGKTDVYYPVQTIEQTGAIYFNWLALLDTNVAVIFCLMLCVASFTLVSSLFILVLDNVPAIGILRSIGASRSMVRAVFVDLGMRIVLRGIIIGNIPSRYLSTPRHIISTVCLSKSGPGASSHST